MKAVPLPARSCERSVHCFPSHKSRVDPPAAPVLSFARARAFRSERLTMTPQLAEALRDDPADAAKVAYEDEHAAKVRVGEAATLLKSASPPDLAGFCDAFYSG